MKIVKLITSHGGKSFSGRGGHYYSLSKIAKILSKEHEITIFSLGNAPSEVLESNKIILNIYHIYVNNVYDIFNFYKHKTIKSKVEKCDVIHCYDIESFMYGNKLARKFNKPIILTKCGGGNKYKFFPYIKDLIVFSEEDKDFILNKAFYKDSNVHVISNRVDKINPDKQRIHNLKNLINYNNEFIILIIARFAKYYLKAHLQAMKLGDLFKQKGIKTKVILIGYPNEVNIVEVLKEKSGESDHIICQPEYCKNASQLIPIADIVIGHGRSIMEAAQFEKILLVPSKDGPLPHLVDEKNIMSFIYHNMTGRGRSYSDSEDLIDQILLTTSNKNNFSKKIYDKYFNINQSVEFYNNIYNSMDYNNDLKKNISEYFLTINKILKLFGLK